MRRRPSAFDLMVTLVGVLLVVSVAVNLPEVVRAARSGAGVHGTFTAKTRSCVSHPGHTACNWRGRFRSDDGTVDSAGVVLHGDGPGLQVGAQVEARDVGRPRRVYMMAGSREWIVSALFAAAGLFLIRRGGVHRFSSGRRAQSSRWREAARAPAASDDARSAGASGEDNGANISEHLRR